MSHAAGLESIDTGSILRRAIGECPVTKVTLGGGGAELMCLLDTGAQVSTITESFFREHLARVGDPVDVSSLLRISGAQGLDIPYVGYVELQITIFGERFDNMGFLIVKDPQSKDMGDRKREALVY